MSGAPKTIAILLFDGFEELDAIGPYEVLSSWTRIWPDDGWRTITAGVSGPEAVRAAKGLLVVPDTGLDDAGPIDILVYPGGRGTIALMGDTAHIASTWPRTWSCASRARTGPATSGATSSTTPPLPSSPEPGR